MVIISTQMIKSDLEVIIFWMNQRETDFVKSNSLFHAELSVKLKSLVVYVVRLLWLKELAECLSILISIINLLICSLKCLDCWASSLKLAWLRSKIFFASSKKFTWMSLHFNSCFSSATSLPCLYSSDLISCFKSWMSPRSLHSFNCSLVTSDSWSSRSGRSDCCSSWHSSRSPSTSDSTSMILLSWSLSFCRIWDNWFWRSLTSFSCSILSLSEPSLMPLISDCSWVCSVESNDFGFLVYKSPVKTSLVDAHVASSGI